MKITSSAVMKPKMAVPSARAQPSSRALLIFPGGLRLAGDGLAGLTGGKANADTRADAGENRNPRAIIPSVIMISS